MTRTEFKLWLQALRSGKYSKGKNYLHIKGEEERFCCLGVFLHAVRKLEPDAKDDGFHYYYYNNESGTIAEYAKDFYSKGGCNIKDKDLSVPKRLTLTNMNDEKNYSFSKIANILEKNPENYVKFGRKK